MTDTLLWSPDPQQLAESPWMAFAQFAGDRAGLSLADPLALHAWSISDRDAFWSAVWDFCGVRGTKGERIIDNGDAMPGARFFPDAQLNFAENLLSRSGPEPAMLFRAEDKTQRSMSWDELHALVSRLQQAFRAHGVGKGDRVAAMMPNMPETVAFMLAAASIGAIWSSCSPDFGVQGVLDRFGQIEPELFISCDGYWYNGKRQEVTEKLARISAALDAKAIIIVPLLDEAETVAAAVPGAQTLAAFIADFPARAVEYAPLPFAHPLYILFSSGTTGVPKCIVHSAGGTLLQHLKELRLHCGLEPGERLFYFTTCGWMMWNWLVSGLAVGATLCLYDGSPFHPDGNVLFDYAAEERFSVFGTSAKFIDAVRKSGLEPARTHDLSSLRLLNSTGSPLSPEGFSFVYEGIKSDVHLASISGGTDIVSCFVLGIPALPVYRGEIQGPGLGLAVDVWDDTGEPVTGEKGELVCTKPFPAMPVGFWNDPDDQKYHAAYFSRFDNVWTHGDFAEWTPHHGIIIHGRSDATLNPGGVRIGTAEIYNQVEQLEEVIESICIGQDWEDDVRVVLFVRLVDGVELDDALKAKIRARIRAGASPRHVPARIIAVSDIPRTKSGKITELAVRDIVHGRQVKNQEALANPEALELFAGLDELKS
ncbi:acetoacetate--CoA ligase [Hoeflea sp. YIM 152468]|uniref:acetoacetate--CoA ligase n=1 Tax=Hoeflea sp. YIM 152468 TaxID=3031759 RepID=UPI0023DA5F4A|nr:acetoacetate--CoA ligase [Hoeflea sp. YIM 152468]MDF1606597.1 acetoacetate--CoA ligase [Hoeflea sp. YIM 152468]